MQRIAWRRAVSRHGGASILSKRLTEAALACGAHLAAHEPSAYAMRARRKPARIHNNCSGKHAGMLAHSVQHMGDPRLSPARHPMQQRVVSTLARWMRIEPERSDRGSMAADCRHSRWRLTRWPRLREVCGRGSRRRRRRRRDLQCDGRASRFVAGTDRLDTDLMRVGAGRLFAKVGAEGFYCAGIPLDELGVALKVEDGAKRAAEPALLAVLRQIDAIDSAEFDHSRSTRPRDPQHPLTKWSAASASPILNSTRHEYRHHDCLP